MASRRYYTVIEKLAGEHWTPQYGSYDRQDCKDELTHMSNSAHALTRFKIVRTGDTQVEINQAVSMWDTYSGMNQA